MRSLPGFVKPSNKTRLTKIDSAKALGCQGLKVGSAPMGVVTVPPSTGCSAAAVVGCGAALDAALELVAELAAEADELLEEAGA